MHQKSMKPSGFKLVELTIVVAIIGVLAAIALMTRGTVIAAKRSYWPDQRLEKTIIFYALDLCLTPWHIITSSFH